MTLTRTSSTLVAQPVNIVTRSFRASISLPCSVALWRIASRVRISNEQSHWNRVGAFDFLALDRVHKNQPGLRSLLCGSIESQIPCRVRRLGCINAAQADIKNNLGGSAALESSSS